MYLPRVLVSVNLEVMLGRFLNKKEENRLCSYSWSLDRMSAFFFER